MNQRTNIQVRINTYKEHQPHPTLKHNAKYILLYSHTTITAAAAAGTAAAAAAGTAAAAAAATAAATAGDRQLGGL